MTKSHLVFLFLSLALFSSVVYTKLNSSPLLVSSPQGENIVKNENDTVSDFSYIQVTTRTPETVMLTDNQGRRTGYSENTGVLKEIPNSHYEINEPYGDLTGKVSPPPIGEGVVRLYVKAPEPGRYTITRTDSGDYNYGFSVDVSDSQAHSESYTRVFQNTIWPKASGSLSIG